MTATIIPFKPKVQASSECRNAVLDHYHLMLGINRRQEEMAHKLSWRGNRGELVRAFVRFAEAQSEFNKVLEAYREELLKALATKCPAAAKHIREGKPPRKSRSPAMPPDRRT